MNLVVQVKAAPIRTLSLEKTTLTLGVQSFFLAVALLAYCQKVHIKQQNRKLFKHFNLEKKTSKFQLKDFLFIGSAQACSLILIINILDMSLKLNTTQLPIRTLKMNYQ